MCLICFLFVIDTPTTEFYTLSLHDALPILHGVQADGMSELVQLAQRLAAERGAEVVEDAFGHQEVRRLHAAFRLEVRELERSEEHTSELQSHSDLVCRLLLEKKNRNQKRRQ